MYFLGSQTTKMREDFTVNQRGTEEPVEVGGFRMKVSFPGARFY